MDLTLWLILIVLIFIAIQIASAVSILGRIECSNDIAIKCMDAHETIFKKMAEEIEQQGVAIDEIRNTIQSG
ncbi:hypothetical protein EHJ11_18920 [Cronobacter turicensis]|uniref:hypothetical protein n=1 Tax=Cronobacter turicensis TaxID=413502 RepID=UPI0013764ACE|nr:hypothetical protein [Cronobacter turicensis]NCH64890.1 hypothetical protein [Cronobacter turicensis]